MKVTKANITSTLKETPTIVKVGVGVLGLYIVSKTLKNLKDVVKGDGFGKKYNTSLNELEKNNIKPSYADSTYLQFADRIYVEYWGELISDIEDVTPVFEKMNNDADMIKLTQAFGERRVLFSTSKYGLGVILNRAFGTKGVEQINAILKKKGITYRF